MEYLPAYIPLVFVLAIGLAIFFFFKAADESFLVLATTCFLLGIQSIAAYYKVYRNTYAIPPRFLYLVLPPIILIIVLFRTAKGKQFIDNLWPGVLTLLHIVRIPVEFVLYWLYQHKVVPQLMTFHGRNFDIVSGITAPFIFYFGYIKKVLGKNVLLIWNIVCLGLLLNIAITAALSTPFSFQKFAFDQPNVAVLYFPYVLLPGYLVPLVLFSHLVVIRQLTVKSKTQSYNA